MLEITALFVLAAALSADTFAFALGYGAAKTKITVVQAVAISLLCSAAIAVFGIIGSEVSGYISPQLCRISAFTVLTATGLAKLLQKNGSVKTKKLTVREIVTLSAVMSIDGLGAGFGNGLCGCNYLLLPVAFAVTLAAVLAGNRIGFRLGSAGGTGTVKGGGAVLILLGISKLIF